MTVHRVVLLVVFVFCFTPCLYADNSYEEYARVVTGKAIETQWDYEQSYLSVLCASKKRVLSKMPTAAKGMKENWVKGSEDGSDLKIVSAKQVEMATGLGMQTDVTLTSPSSGKTGIHRY